MSSPDLSVSVVLPCYNARAFIARAIDSVLAQQGPFDIELIVVDDKSRDGSLAFLQDRYGHDPRVRLLEMGRNSGPGPARNEAIRQAKGDWIALIDADDEWRSDRLLALTPLCAEADFVFDNLVGFDHKSKKETGELFPVMPSTVTVEMMAGEKAPSGYDFGFAKPLIRRAFLEEYGLTYPDLRCNEDLLFYLDILVHGARAEYLPQAFYVYTTRVGQASRLLSPSSNSKSNNMLTADALEAFIARCKTRLTPEQNAALSKRMQEFRSTSLLVQIYEQWMAARYHKIPLAVVLHPSLIPVLARKLVRRIRRKFARS